MKSQFTLVLTYGVFFLLPQISFGQSSWLGGSNGLWDSVINWSAGVPGNGNFVDAVFSPGSPPVNSIDVAMEDTPPKSLEIRALNIRGVEVNLDLLGRTLDADVELRFEDVSGTPSRLVLEDGTFATPLIRFVGTNDDYRLTLRNGAHVEQVQAIMPIGDLFRELTIIVEGNSTFQIANPGNIDSADFVLESGGFISNDLLPNSFFFQNSSCGIVISPSSSLTFSPSDIARHLPSCEINGMSQIGVVHSIGLADLGQLTEVLNGGEMIAANGVNLPSGHQLRVENGDINGTVVSDFGSCISCDSGSNVLGDASSPIGFVSNGVLLINSSSTELQSLFQCRLGGFTAINGGNLTSLSNIVVETGAVVMGNGVIDGRFVGQSGAVVSADNGNLTVGKNVPNGFSFNGDLHTHSSTVEILSSTSAQLGSLTSLGSLEMPGTLQVQNGGVVDFASVISGFGTVDSPNSSITPLIVNGNAVGNDINEPLEFNGYVKGIGFFENVVFNGTFSPGLSPTLVFATNLGFGPSSCLEMELGGLLPGIQHDQIIDSGGVSLAGVLKLSLIDNFQPVEGDTFDILDWNTISGQFNAFDFSEAPLPSNLAWDVSRLRVDGTIGVVSNVLLGDVNLDGLINLLDVEPFVALLTNGDFQNEADINQDGFVNLLDIEGFVALLSAG